MKPFYKDSLTTIYNTNSEKLKDDIKSELMLTDPPYGLDKAWTRKFHGKNGGTKLWGEIPEWDKRTVDLRLIKSFIVNCDRSIIWGGNFYNLPPSRCWMVWDKLQSNRGADCELAWTNLDMAPKVFRMSRIDAYQNRKWFDKEHGAEKPIQLGIWCVELSEAKSVVDPFMGCGSFIIAARSKGVKNVGIEINEKYCSIVVDRIKSGVIENKSGFF